MGYKLTVNKINCEVSVTDREGYKIDYNNYIENEFDITITCDSNYTFVSAPVISYINEEGYEDTEYFEQISNTKYGLTIYLDSDAIIDAVAKINKTYLHVNTPLYTEVIITDSNGFVINNDSLESGVTYTLTIKPKAGYSINDTQVSYKNINGEDITVNIENEITFTSSSDIIVTTNVLLINRYVWEVYNKLTNATFEPSLIYCDEVTLLSIIANDNYYFNDLPEVNYYDDIGVIKKLKGTRISKNRIDFTIPVMNHNQYVTRRPLFISGVATTDNFVSKKYGIINVYNPTPEELQALSKVRYNQIKNGTSVSIVDLAQYISRLFKLYCNVATDSKAEIKLADVKTKVKADVVSDYEITVDCGIRKISGLNDNILDYTETVLEMFIPFVGIKTLDTVKVMNETIRLLYKVNVINGDCIAFIINSLGDAIYEFKGNMAFNIPYIMNDKATGYSEKEASDTDLSLMGFVPTLYIRSKIMLDNADTVQNNHKRDYIYNFNGYHEFIDFYIDNLYLVDDEKKQLKNLLESGVIV